MQKAYMTGLAAPPCMKVWRFTVKMHTNPQEKRVWRTAVLPNKQESLFGLRVFRRAGYRTFTVNLHAKGLHDRPGSTTLHESLEVYCVPAPGTLGCTQTRQGVSPLGSGFGARLSCRISKGLIRTARIPQGRFQDFYSNPAFSILARICRPTSSARASLSASTGI